MYANDAITLLGFITGHGLRTTDIKLDSLNTLAVDSVEMIQ